MVQYMGMSYYLISMNKELALIASDKNGTNKFYVGIEALEQLNLSLDFA